jgi:hypothetical protein
VLLLPFELRSSFAVFVTVHIVAANAGANPKVSMCGATHVAAIVPVATAAFSIVRRSSPVRRAFSTTPSGSSTVSFDSFMSFTSSTSALKL